MIDRFMPVGASAHAASFDAVLMSVHVHMAIQAVAWGAFLVFCLIRFRRGAHPQASHDGIRPLIPVVAIAAVIVGDVMLLANAAFPAWLARSTAPPAASRPLELKIFAEQFAWNIQYPGPDTRFGPTDAAFIGPSNPLGIDRRHPDAKDDVGLLNTLMLPLDRPVIVHLTSRDVVHSFTLNEMRVKQDATPGLVARTWFTPTLAGKWEIACSQLCGLGHYRMRGDVSVVSEDEWQRWLAREVALISPTPAQR